MLFEHEFRGVLQDILSFAAQVLVASRMARAFIAIYAVLLHVFIMVSSLHYMQERRPGPECLSLRLPQLLIYMLLSRPARIEIVDESVLLQQQGAGGRQGAKAATAAALAGAAPGAAPAMKLAGAAAKAATAAARRGLQELPRALSAVLGGLGRSLNGLLGRRLNAF